MPTGQPSNAPDQATPTDDRSAAAVLADDALDTTPGGGGLGGASAAGATRGGGLAPDTPFENGVAEGEARRQSAETTPATGGRSAGS